MKPGSILQHGPTSPPGLFGEWADARGVPVEVHATFADADAPYEGTIEIVKRWASSDHERLASLGITDAERQLEAGRAGAATARTNAFRLFDFFWKRAQRADRRDQ